MRTFLITFLIIISCPLILFADNTSGTNYLSGEIEDQCKTSLDDEDGQAYITFLGDSLGDLVDHFGYGWTGWNGYLAFHRSDIPWRTQNLAVVGKRTHQIFDYLAVCTDTDHRGHFITSNNVAFEAGGNDLLDWYPILLYMPWKFSSYIDPLTQKKVVGSSEYLAHNTKAIIRFLRHPLIDKNVLVMGNFPALSFSPTLGHVGDYFNAFEKILDDKYLKTKEVKGTLRMSREQSAEFLEDFLDIFRVLEDIIRTLYNFITGTIEIIAGAFKWNIDITINQPNPSSLKELWLNWYHTVEPKASPTTVLSIGLLLSQSELQKTVIEEREYTRNQTKIYPNPNNKDGSDEYADYDVPN